MTLTISHSVFKRLVWGAVVVSTFAFGVFAFALTKDDIVFPVLELAGCESEKACRAYCDLVENRPACFEFAKKYNLLEAKEVDRIERVQSVLDSQGGPGGCKAEKECEAYCSDVNRIEECLAFAREHGIMGEGELREAEQVQAALASGARLPGGCQNKDACEAYCQDPAHMEECITFAEAAGFMSSEELEEAKRILPLMQRGETPGGCRAKEQCEAYCEDESHFEECIAFAEKAGFVSPEEAQMARKTGGKGPGGCRGPIECDQYCKDPAHMEECFNFGVEHGFISPEEAERMQKLGGPAALAQGGPGGCRGKEECEAFCSDPQNQETCFNFAVEKGLIDPEEAVRFRESGGPEAFQGPGGCSSPLECMIFCQDPAHLQECRQFAGPPPDEFPGEPPQDFLSPPGFGSIPPPEQGGEFMVPPGFAPLEQGEFRMREDFEDLEEAREQGNLERVQNLEDMLRQMDEFGQYQQEFMPPQDQSSEFEAGQIPPEQFEQYPPPDSGFFPPPSGEFHSPSGEFPEFQPPSQFTPPGEFQPSEGLQEFHEEPPADFQSGGGLLRRVLATLLLLFGL